MACLDDVCVDLVDLSGPEAAVSEGAVDNPGDGRQCIRAERGEICGPEVKSLHLPDPSLHNIPETGCSIQGLSSSSYAIKTQLKAPKASPLLGAFLALSCVFMT